MHKALIYYYHYIALKSLNITFKKTSLFSKLIPIVLIIKKIIIINDFLIHFFKGSTGECELAVVSSPPVSRKPHYAKEVSSDQLLNLRYILCLHFICLHFWIVYMFHLFTFSEVSPKLTVVVTKCDPFPRHNYVKLICNQPRLLLLARQGIHIFLFYFVCYH